LKQTLPGIPEKALMKTQKVTITALVNSPLENVWRCWTEPEHITQWNFADTTWSCPHVSNELRVGGRYFARMEARDGSFGFDFEAIYDEVAPLQSIRYTMTDGRCSTTTFEPQNRKTSVTTVFDAESENDVEMQRYGWQAILDNFKAHAERQVVHKNTVCIWYARGAEDAAEFYAAVFPESCIVAIHRAPSDYPDGRAGDVLTVEFMVAGIPCIGLNGGPRFKHSEAFSFQIMTEDQEETDRYWNAIVNNGGEESQCGWCKDRWGISWQITPRVLTQAVAEGGETAKRAFEAMMPMRKIDVALIEAAVRAAE
jgi:predicted 3-demethylubiquinone-9 3-methyltransferase (glyoxalase superfamily)